MKTHLYLSIGSNRSKEDVEKAAIWLKNLLTGFNCSDIYRTPAVNSKIISSYDNAVASGYTDREISLFNNMIKQYEISCGRDSRARSRGEVPIDIDIVIAGNKILRQRDFDQHFFQIGYLKLSRSVIEYQSDK